MKCRAEYGISVILNMDWKNKMDEIDKNRILGNM
jgi:hypothetical protein